MHRFSVMTTPISKLSSLVELAGSGAIRTQTLAHAIVEELLGLGAKVHTCSQNAKELSSCLMGWENLGFESAMCRKRAQRERPMEIVSSVFDGKLNILLLKIRIVWERESFKRKRE
ncbi:hypothetical protein G4B88_023687 [Cannabis sativa]|uniref:Uncharacterized protein n=1 Tax=Cannabis sativa TaxID=3483 RepID=A0A7J6HV53_CANSA|nr:hypothetical protein G4B88_023687 [Cannabis sativa]